jgi:hypothetical protein
MMNKELKAAWIANLRSGKYKQGVRFLRCTDSRSKKERFCCLGVLCETMGVPAQQKKPNWPSIYDGYDTTLSPALQKQAGLPTEVTELLITLNDGAGVREHLKGTGLRSPRPRTFKEIADWLEKHEEV